MAKGGQQDAKLKGLMAKGFSKTKCTQALKDAGNNADLALRILERQRDMESQRPAPSHKADTAVSSSHADAATATRVSAAPLPSAASSIPSLRRTNPPPSTFTELTAAQKKLQKQRERRHPCVVQYGSCQYGDFCLLKDFPGDVCVQHFQGCCIYGASCRHRHVVDGVDVRDVLRDAQAEEEALLLRLKDGASYRVQADAQDAKLRVATLVERGADGDDEGGDGEDGLYGRRAMSRPPPQPSDFNLIRGSVPSYTEPLFSDPGLQQQYSTSDADDGSDTNSDAHEDQQYVSTQKMQQQQQHPTPFADLARAAGVEASGGKARKFQTNTAAPPPQASVSSASPPLRKKVGRHPCVAQYGNCKYGDACVYADRDADVCIHFLHGRCRYSAEDCHYRHETDEEYQHALRLRVGLPLSAAADTSRDGDAASVSPTVHEDPQAELSHTLPPRGGAHATPARGGRVKVRLQDGGKRPDRVACASSPSPPSLPRVTSTSTHAHSALPSFEDLNALLSKVSSSNDVGELHSGGTTTPVSDAESRVFLGLLEAFPAVEPVVVLQALRLHAGDPLRTADMISQFGALTSADVESVAAALALAVAEEAAQREAAEEAAVCADHHNALLTLLMLFPSLEVAAVEAALTRHKDDFAATYNTLLCAQEKLVQSVLWRESTAKLSPADQLRYEKLCAMFPGLHVDIVRSAFCAAGSDWSSATAALNELLKELLSLEAVELPAKPVMWHPTNHTTSSRRAASPPRLGRVGSPLQASEQRAQHPPPSFSGAASPLSPNSPTVQETSEEAYEAYRAAEREILSFGDWRQVREQAYLINSQRIRVLGQASAAFHQGDGRTAKLLSKEGHRMAVEYNRLNRMAMLALEQERLRNDATSTLDLHGFHAAELHDVLVRRVEVCQRKRIKHLRIVVGEGLHSKRGHSSLYSTLMDELRGDPYVKAVTKVKSVKAGYVDVIVQMPPQTS